MSAVILREAVAPDIERVSKLYLANWQSTYRGLLPDEYLDSLTLDGILKTWSDYLNNPENRIYTAFERNDFLGFAACERDEELSECLYLHSLHVAQAARGRGVGSALISRVWERALELNCSELSICVVRGNENARRLYVSLGAKHYKYFTDRADGMDCSSEKLLWTDAPGR